MSLETNLKNGFIRVATEFKLLKTYISGSGTGDVSALSTTATNLVAAINEVLGIAESAAGGGMTEEQVQDMIDDAIAALVDSAPGALDTLKELADALGDDPDFAATITNALALKAPLASPTFTGTPAAPTASAATNTTQIATTAFVRLLIGDPEVNLVTEFENALT